MAEGTYNLILFISGMSVTSSRAIENIQKIVSEHPGRKIDLKIIDVSKEKEKAFEYQLFALPSLLKTTPIPVRTVLGDLSDKKKVLRILDIS